MATAGALSIIDEIGTFGSGLIDKASAIEDAATRKLAVISDTINARIGSAPPKPQTPKQDVPAATAAAPAAAAAAAAAMGQGKPLLFEAIGAGVFVLILGAILLFKGRGRGK